MLKIKLHLARLCCVLTTLLISGNVVVSAMNLDVKIEQTTDHHSTKKQLTTFKEDVDQDSSVVNLIKDPTEGDAEFYYIEQVVPHFVFEIEYDFEAKSKVFYNYFPLLKSLPLWIEHRQIRI
jgi:hypothetical protein